MPLRLKYLEYLKHVTKGITQVLKYTAIESKGRSNSLETKTQTDSKLVFIQKLGLV